MPVPLSRYLIYGGIASGGCLIDLLTKHWVFDWLGIPGSQPIWWIWKGYFGIETSLNGGALFGMGQGQSAIFAVISVAAFLGIVYWLFLAGGARDCWMTTATGFITAGIFGNLFDRLGLWTPPWAPQQRITMVRDWVLWCYGEEHKWPNFNLADVFLVTGAIMLLLHAFLWPAAESNAPKKPATSS